MPYMSAPTLSTNLDKVFFRLLSFSILTRLELVMNSLYSYLYISQRLIRKVNVLLLNKVIMLGPNFKRIGGTGRRSVLWMDANGWSR